MAIFTGKHVEEAIEKGLQALGLSRSQADIKVLAKEKKGFLGFGKQDAQVEVVTRVVEQVLQTQPRVSAATAPASPSEASDPEKVPAPPAPAQPAPVSPVRPVVRPLAPVASSVDHELEVVSSGASPEPQGEAEQEALVPEEDKTPVAKSPRYDLNQATADVLAYLEKIIYEMDIEATITASQTRRQINLQIDTPEPGRLIGYHGKVLKSLQLLAQNFLHDRYSKNFNLSLNVHDYLEHRAETLVEVANRVANKVLETGKAYRMDPMTNSERKVIHKTISRIPGVESYSEGDDPNRYVVIVHRDAY